ncbi:Gldg family protein [Bordetella sp. 2513F-2]
MKRLAEVWLPVAALAAVLLAANIWAVRHLGRLDLTATRVYSLSEDSLQVARAVPGGVSVTWFYDARNKSMTDALDLLRQYARANPRIAVRGVDPGLRPAEARAAGVQFAGTAVFQSEARRLVVHGGTETDFTNALIRISQADAQRVCFTQGHLEADPYSLAALDDLEDHNEDENLVARVEVHEQHGLAMARQGLETLGYEVAAVQAGSLRASLDGCAVAVVAGPRVPFGADDAQALHDWTLRGGKTLLLLEPDAAHGLDALLAGFGIERAPGAVADPQRHYRSDPGSPAVSDYPRHKLTRGVPMSVFPGVAALQPAAAGIPADVSVTPLAQTSPQARTRGGEPQVHTLMALAVRTGPAQRRPMLLVAGDSDFATNRHYATLGDGTLFLNGISVLAEQDPLLAIRPRHYADARVELSNQQMRAVFWTSAVLLPLLALATGLLLWWRRR